MRRGRARLLVALLALLAVPLGALAPASAARPDSGTPWTAWTAASPGVFGIGDSLLMQCGRTLGLGRRSLGMVGWPSATSDDLRARMSNPAGDWPFTTEPSHADELAGFRDAGTWVVGLGTNDVTRLSVARFRENVGWFLEQSGGRPVLWFTVHRPAHRAQVAAVNQVLADAEQRWPNLRLLDWHGYVAAHPEVLAADGIHIASYAACREGRLALVQEAVPPVEGQEADPSWVDPPPQPPPDPDPVAAEYDRTGGAAGPLGAPTGDLSCGRRGDGCARFYENGAIAWSPATGAHVLPARVAAAWRPFGEIGGTGYPVAGAVCGLVDGGCRQRFQAGWLYWSSRTAPRQVTAPVLAAWSARGAEEGPLGYPVTGLPCGLVHVGCVQHFTGGSVFWSASTGAHAVTGAVRARHRAAGAENGRLGYPTDDTVFLFRGCGQHVTGGGGVATGAVRTRYLPAGAARGPSGDPTIDTVCVARGRGQHFTHGSIYWSSVTGARAVAGRIRTRWFALGGAQGHLGYPVSEQRAVSGGIAQRFQGGTLTWRDGRWV